MKILIAVPAYNEEKIIIQSLQLLLNFCRNKLAGQWEVVVADNNSTDPQRRYLKNSF
jgi:glycosyltransferase involved in cell wall biosynthesis